ncbi:zinc transporter ZupT [Caldibacillus sp. 210928-DFI.2.22]|uniref:zinc transporter ZupT n=1 Tax=unclassified Caldibacillus TaxID=2641266 RepID=UPI001D06CB1E|nr:MULTISPECIES: zinc transporter ZupT [unclassified Caldibacillus]MCB7068677.1 zinc transporter ZupT [Caldibacillus sp. 210928-DFI.2.22]MCB7072205.1 zinc transporter ZupT [Caldibacillus sp. 210928-DFI.2.18]
MTNDVVLALILTLFAGLAAGIGGLLVLFTKITNKKFLSFSLGLSAGVMIFVSLADIFPEARESLTGVFGDKFGYMAVIIGYFSGIIFIGLLDKITEQKLTVKTKDTKDPELMRIGIFTSIALAIHNFPDGVATFMSTLQEPSIGFAIAVAVFIHNIPEGIAVAIPIYYATDNKFRSFLWALFSGLVEPVGALLTYLVLMRFLNTTVLGVVLAVVAGMMVFISISELLPTAKKYDEGDISIYGFVFGMLIMAISLLLLGE